MTIACTFSPASASSLDGTVTVSFTRLAATTAYTVVIGVNVTQNIPIVSDGSGDASFTWVPPRVGNHSFHAVLTTSTLAGTFWAGAVN